MHTKYMAMHGMGGGCSYTVGSDVARGQEVQGMVSMRSYGVGAGGSLFQVKGQHCWRGSGNSDFSLKKKKNQQIGGNATGRKTGKAHPSQSSFPLNI